MCFACVARWGEGQTRHRWHNVDWPYDETDGRLRARAKELGYIVVRKPPDGVFTSGRWTFAKVTRGPMKALSYEGFFEVPPLSEQVDPWEDPRAVFGFCGRCKEHSVLVFDEDGELVGSDCCGAKLIAYDEDPT